MAESIYLHGSEDVRSAANTMRNAAEEMQRAASSFQSAVELQQRTLDNWMWDFKSALNEHLEAMKAVKASDPSTPEQCAQ